MKLISGYALADEGCEGGWTAYKDEKCLKIFQDSELLSYEDAETFCKEKYDSNLISVDLEEKQTFLETFLKSNNVADNIWIGLKYVGNAYKWSDGSQLIYTNWDSGSPKNNSSYCVQVETENNYGIWSDVLCTKKNLVVCEKVQLWSAQYLQSTVMNIIKNPLPVDFIYVQLPDQKSPLDIWPWMEWKDITSSYAGLFFRAYGGGSAGFGQVQEGNAPRLDAVKMEEGYWVDQMDVAADGQYSGIIHANGDGDNNWGIRFRVSSGEVRPRNTAIKIWQRIN